MQHQTLQTKIVQKDHYTLIEQSLKKELLERIIGKFKSTSLSIRSAPASSALSQVSH